MSPRTGRPRVDDPMVNRLSVSLDKKTITRLEAYCKEHSITKGEAMRRGLHLLFDRDKK